MDLIKGYDSGSGSEQEKILKKIKLNQPIVNLAPKVDISTYESEKKSSQALELQKLYPENEKPNHLTGQADLYYMNTFNFEEQYHNFKNLGFAYDPSDGSERKILVNSQFSHLANDDKQNFISRSVFSKTKKETDEQRKLIAKNRKKCGGAGTGEFLGPWAGYENEDKFTANELSSEQREILNKIEEKRQKKLEEQKNASTEVIIIFFCYF